MLRARNVTVWPLVHWAGTVSVYAPATVVAAATLNWSITTIAPPSASPPRPTTLPVTTADCASASRTAAPSNKSSPAAQRITLNRRRLCMTPPSEEGEHVWEDVEHTPAPNGSDWGRTASVCYSAPRAQTAQECAW